MKRFIFIPVLLLALYSCSPQTFTMNIEMRHPSRSGLDLGRKTMAVVYADNGSYRDTMFLRHVASGFAERMEEDYFGGAQVIPFFTSPADTGLTSLKRMQQLVMDTGCDVIFLFDVPEFSAVSFGETTRSMVSGSRDSSFVNMASIPFKLKLHVYDSMNKEDKVLSFNGTSAVRSQFYHDGTLTADELKEKVWKNIPVSASEVGRKSTVNFISTWVAEQYSLYYYDDLSGDWESPSQAAFEYKWTDAIKQWTGLVSKYKGPEKRACAAYDIATACYMLGNYDLATRWLDRADAEFELPLSKGLRKRIQARIQ